MEVFVRQPEVRQEFKSARLFGSSSGFFAVFILFLIFAIARSVSSLPSPFREVNIRVVGENNEAMHAVEVWLDHRFVGTTDSFGRLRSPVVVRLSKDINIKLIDRLSGVSLEEKPMEGAVAFEGRRSGHLTFTLSENI